MADSSSRNGNWAYRSYHNNPDQGIFGEGTFTFVFSDYDKFGGTLDMGSGYVLDLQGTFLPGEARGVLPGDEFPSPSSTPNTYRIVGTGRTSTPTAGWELPLAERRKPGCVSGWHRDPCQAT
jgi:hypothetical protein